MHKAEISEVFSHSSGTAIACVSISFIRRGVLIVLLILFEKEIRHHMEALLMWLESHKSRGFLIFIGLEFIGVPLLFPVSFITVAGGFIFSD